MQISQQELDGGVLKVTLSGPFDIAGAADVDVPFSVIGGRRDKVIVDFSDVDFLASIGVRVLVKAAKSMGNRGGTMALFNVGEAPRKVLASTGVDTIIAVTEDEPSAIAAVS
ncbi:MULTISPECIES: STAS domain-containing protein [unclassified Roseitalea]|uniref:STAS domain-containing protein n=1 Tax=unclassified Roseitalea TaxID=2639107 RepID=UPI00273E5D6A|nr:MULTISPECIES: STAS domain-containing protein [unclassified Roseitalea]